MRPVANFTLHAILAACLAALAASSAAAAKPQIDNEGHVYLSGAIFGSPGASQQLEVHGFTWGPRQSTARLKPAQVTSYQLGGSGVDAPPHSGGGRNELGVDDTAGKEKGAAASGRVTGIVSDPTEPAAIHDVKPPRDASLGSASERQGQAGHSMLGASERATVGGAQTEDQATGKRQHKPMVARGYYDSSAPPVRGSLILLASGPCRVGARYPSLTLNGRGKSYLLQDVQVADCGAAAGPEEQITFVYAKVTVRGWDPATKQR
jgi:hypothetical protein